MSDNRLNLTGLTYFYNRIKTLFAKQADLDTLEGRVDDIVAEGGEPNVIETVKVNGTALTPDAQKAVNVTVPTTVAELTDSSDYALQADIPTDTSDLTNDGDGTSPFATQSYVQQNGGKIDTISVNGTQQTITNKNVDITVPTAVSDLTNDENYQTDADVADAIAEQIGKVYQPKGSIAFANLPSLAAANLGNVYNITDAFTTTADFVEGAGASYPAGTNVAIVNVGTEQSPTYKYDVLSGVVDLSDYWNTTNLVAITTAQIDALFARGEL